MNFSKKDGIYAGIGSRETPPDIAEQMFAIAVAFAKKKYTLRSGGADGADMAFQYGALSVEGKVEIFIPWNGFNNHSNGHKGAILVTDSNIVYQADQLSRKLHPNYNGLSRGGRALMVRNVFQILGASFVRFSDFVICWTKDGADGIKKLTSRETGGTGQAIRLAVQHLIPVYNLGNNDVKKNWDKWLNENVETLDE